MKKKPRNKPAGKPFQGKVIYLSRQSSQQVAGRATRLERDTMGELAVPADAYYGVQTARAIQNFPISSLRFPRAMIRAMGLIKRAAATVNQSLGLLDKKSADAINQAAAEVIEGAIADHDGTSAFVEDSFGSWGNHLVRADELRAAGSTTGAATAPPPTRAAHDAPTQAPRCESAGNAPRRREPSAMPRPGGGTAGSGARSRTSRISAAIGGTYRVSRISRAIGVRHNAKGAATFGGIRFDYQLVVMLQKARCIENPVLTISVPLASHARAIPSPATWFGHTFDTRNMPLR